MKKVSLLLGALVLGFVLTSCQNKKDLAVNLFNTFFDEEIASLNQVEDADAFLAYYDAADARFDTFFEKLNQEIPLDENDNIIGLSQEDSDAAMKIYDDRLDAYLEQRDAKGEALYEPFLADAENVLFDEIGALADQYETVEEIPDELFNPLLEKLEAKFDVAEKYVLLSNDEQYDRFLVLSDIFYDDEEEVEETEE